MSLGQKKGEEGVEGNKSRGQSIGVREEVPERMEDEGYVFAFEFYLQITH